MESGTKVEVEGWQSDPLPAFVEKKPPAKAIPTAYIGLMGTILLHGVFFQSLPTGNGLSIPPDVQAGRNHGSKGVNDNNRVIIAMLTSTESETRAAANFVPSASLNTKPVLFPEDVAPPSFPQPTLPLSEDAGQKSGANDGDAENQIRLFGMYTGQIQARIERAWRRPRSPVRDGAASAQRLNGVTFQCQAQIVQDPRGNVQEILLPECSGSPAWQHSLVVAIQQASPLPAPPSESVFTNSITLTFVGLPYSAGSDEDEYQLPTRKR
jgi:TonB C terminal